MPQPLLIHVHVPKCAGTTVEAHLAAELGRSAAWFAPKRTRKVPLGWFTRKYSTSPLAPPDEIRAVSGHFIGESIEQFFAGRRIVRSIILRDPESHMLSYYNYRMMRYMGLGQKPYSFSLFLKATRQNFVSHFLLERWLEMPWVDLIRLSDAQKIRYLDNTLSKMDYIAPIDQTDKLIENVSSELGISTRAPRQNITEDKQASTGWKILRASDVSAEDRAELKARTQLDRYLWRRWVLKEPIAFNSTAQSRFVRSELVRPHYQCARRLARAFG